MNSLRLLLPCIFLLSVFRITVSAQHNPYDYYLNNSALNISSEGIVTDIDIFLEPLESNTDLFMSLSDFNFSSVKYQRRGYDHGFNKNYLGNIELSGGASYSSDYSLYGNLRRLNLTERRVFGAAPGMDNVGLLGEADVYFANAHTTADGIKAAVFGADRRARGGGRVSIAGKAGPKTNYAAVAYGRWGRDAHIEGVFTEEISFSGIIDRQLAEEHKLTLLIAGTSSLNGLRSYTTREAFELTDNNLYNPSWGYFNGEPRNSKVANRFQPLFLLNYAGKAGAKTAIEASLSYRFGRNSYSSLSWINAGTPYPDYFRYMPSYAANPDAAEIIAADWKSSDRDVTQVNWNDLYNVNNMDLTATSYFLEDRVEDINHLQLALSARTEINERAAVSYGLRLRSDNSLFYKRMKDLMNGKPIRDIDQYMLDGSLQDDESVLGRNLFNDTRNPDRRIGNGDRFGYNYNILSSKAEAYGIVSYRDRHLFLYGAAELGMSTLARRGNYEKELYPGALSFGRSKRHMFDTYTLKASAGYSFSPRHILSLSAATASAAPSYGNILVSPDYLNKTLEKPATVNMNGTELNYIMTLDRLRLKLSGYYTYSSDETAIYSYYDVIQAAYSDMLASGIDKEYYGVEVAARIDVSSRFSLGLAAAAASGRYGSDPSVEIRDDATQVPYVIGSRSYMKGYRLGGSPQTVLSAELRYNSRGWLTTVVYNYMADRYITPNPLRRMERAFNLAGSTERFREFVLQEKIPDAGTIDLFVMKSFVVNQGSRITALLSVNNLLNDKDIIYNGYEQMRIMKRGASPNEQYVPSDSKYLYAYGRTLYMSLIYSF